MGNVKGWRTEDEGEEVRHRGKRRRKFRKGREKPKKTQQ